MATEMPPGEFGSHGVLFNTRLERSLIRRQRGRAFRLIGASVRPNNALFDTRAITVRKALLSDHQALVEADEYAQTDRTRAAYIKDCLAAGECLVGEIGTEVLGFVMLNYSFFNCGFVPLVVVRKPFRRRGLGLMLLSEAAARCRSSKLFISANASNKAAQALFAKAGFIESGSVQNLNDDLEVIYFKGCGQLIA